MKENSKLTIEHSIINFVFKLYDKKIISSDGIAKRQLIKDRYYQDLKRKPYMDMMKFQKFLEIIKKYDLILDDKTEGKLEFKVDNIIKTKADMEAPSPKSVKYKQKNDDSDVILSSSDSIELAYVTSFRRFLKKFTPTSKCCPICKLKFLTDSQSVVHFAEHGKLFFIPSLESTIKVDMMMGIDVEIDKIASKLNFNLKNRFNQILKVMEIYLYTSNGLVSVINGNAKVLKPSETFAFSVNVAIFNIPNHKYSLLITSENVVFEYVEQYHIRLKKTADEECTTADESTVSGNFLQYAQLPEYPVTNCIINLSKRKFIINPKEKNQRKFSETCSYSAEEMLKLDQIKNYISVPTDQRLTKDNYVSILDIRNQIEDYDMIRNYKHYTVNNARLKPCLTTSYFTLETSQFVKEPTRLKSGVNVIITVEQLNEPDLMSKGFIYSIKKNDIIIWTDGNVPVDRDVKIEFILNRFTFQLQYQALNMVKQQKISHLFFPELPESRSLTITQFNWFNRDIVTNPEQIIAIQNIVNDTSFPAPYILFGPPGTGKTSTLVEAICQIYKLNPKAHILVTAETNFACNELATRLLKYLPQEDIFRFFSPSFLKLTNGLDIELLNCSNVENAEYRIPFYNEIYDSRIVICTVTTSGRLVLAGIKSDIFDYIFIDECGSAKEIASLIPMAGLGITNEKFSAKIILAGDPKQLGPVVFAQKAVEMGQNCSMLERLMDNKIYHKDPLSKLYNNQLITKLLKNYRSHNAILQFSNENFYEGELKAVANTKITDWALNWSKLPNKSFPIIFHCVFGKMQQDQLSYSYFNRDELYIVKLYLEAIFNGGINGEMVNESDVGVISPYAKQVRMIKDMCFNKGWSNISIGTTEQFQGREKKIIIISMVRSKAKTVGFLKNKKRLNVALTRAKSLLVVIGNAKTLMKDDNWKNFLEYCANNGAIRGVPITEDEQNGPKNDVGDLKDLNDEINSISVN